MENKLKDNTNVNSQLKLIKELMIESEVSSLSLYRTNLTPIEFSVKEDSIKEILKEELIKVFSMLFEPNDKYLRLMFKLNTNEVSTNLLVEGYGERVEALCIYVDFKLNFEV